MDTTDLVRRERQARLHQLIDRLPDKAALHHIVEQVVDQSGRRALLHLEMHLEMLEHVLQTLSHFTDPVWVALETAPADDEPITQEDLNAVQDPQVPVKTLDEVRRELGL
jgi:hypothetical protein